MDTILKLVKRSSGQGCARLMNQRQHDSSYRPLVMDSSPQLPSVTNYTTSTIVPRSNRTHYRQNRTTAYQRHSRSWQAANRAPSSPLLEMLDILKLNARCSNLMRYQVCIPTDPVPTTVFQLYQLRRASGLDGSNLNQRQHDSWVEHNPASGIIGPTLGSMNMSGLTAHSHVRLQFRFLGNRWALTLKPHQKQTSLSRSLVHRQTWRLKLAVH